MQKWYRYVLSLACGHANCHASSIPIEFTVNTVQECLRCGTKSIIISIEESVKVSDDQRRSYDDDQPMGSAPH